MKKNLLVLPLLLITYTTIAQVYQWRGPYRNGIITETGLLKAWHEKGPELLWSFNGLGEGHSSIGPGKDSFFITGLFTVPAKRQIRITGSLR